MTGPGAAAEKRRGYVVFRQVEPGVWYLVGDVDYQPGLSARAERAHAVHDATGGAAGAGELYAALPRDRWHLVHGA